MYKTNMKEIKSNIHISDIIREVDESNMKKKIVDCYNTVRKNIT